MKTILAGVFSVCLFCCNAQSWQWAKSLGYTSSEYASAKMIQNTNGDILIAFTGNNPDLKTDLVWCNAQGDTILKRQVPGFQIQEMFYDQGKVYFCGNFKNTLQFQNMTFTAAGESDAIAGCFDQHFHLMKYKHIATAANESFGSFIRKDDHYFLTGSFSKNFTDGAFTFTTNNQSDCFVMRTDMDFNSQKVFQTSAKYPNEGKAGGVKIRASQNAIIYLLGYGDGFVNFDTIQGYFYEGNFLARFNSDLQLSWVKGLSHGGAGDSYNPQMELDHLNRPCLLFRPGGGGGNIHQIALHKFSSSGTKVLDMKLPMVYHGLLQKDEKENLWVAGHYIEFVPPSYLSIARVDTAHVLSSIIYDPVPNKTVRAFHVRKENDFYIVADFKDTVKFTGFTAIAQGHRFLIHYGFHETVSVPQHSSSLHDVEVYPNPATATLFITGRRLREIQVFNSLGQLCHYSETDSENHSLDLQGWPAGIYLVTVNRTTTRRVIVR